MNVNYFLFLSHVMDTIHENIKTVSILVNSFVLVHTHKQMRTKKREDFLPLILMSNKYSSCRHSVDTCLTVILTKLSALCILCVFLLHILLWLSLVLLLSSYTICVCVCVFFYVNSNSRYLHELNIRNEILFNIKILHQKYE